VARYARGRDYHDVMRPRLRSLAEHIDAAAGTRSLAAVDTSPVLERDLAARAGLGWIGKNTNLLSPDLGSYFFIGVVLTTAGLEADTAQPDRCGTCRACLDACPTGAFVAPRTLDARRCIAYLTIEHRGPVAEELRPGLGDWVFGCDVCQEVCPWNRHAPATREPAFDETDPPGDPAALLALDEAAFRARFRRSALWRARWSGMRRNAALVLGNRRDPAAAAALARAAADADPVVREASRWALRRCNPFSAA
jgi:epoxyqueuosine reductase